MIFHLWIYILSLLNNIISSLYGTSVFIEPSLSLSRKWRKNWIVNRKNSMDVTDKIILQTILHTGWMCSICWGIWMTICCFCCWSCCCCCFCICALLKAALGASAPAAATTTGSCTLCTRDIFIKTVFISFAWAERGMGRTRMPSTNKKTNRAKHIYMYNGKNDW